jgi:hypothetical protein
MSLRSVLFPSAADLSGNPISSVLVEIILVGEDHQPTTAVHVLGDGDLVGLRPKRVLLLGTETQEVPLAPTDELASQTEYQILIHRWDGVEEHFCQVPALVPGAEDPLTWASLLALEGGVIGVDLSLSAHLAAADPHPGYALESALGTAAYTASTAYDAAGAAAGAVLAHGGAVDPHPGYALESALGTAAYTASTAYDAAGAAAGAVSSHAAAADPHPGYVLESAANLIPVSIQSGNYPLVATDSVVVFTATATATLPAATGSGRTYRIVCRAGTLTIDAAGTETIKGAETAVLSAGEDLLLTDTAMGVWE